MLGLILLFIGLSVQYSVKVISGDTRSAVVRWRQQLLDWDIGVDIYEGNVYPNPPIMALILLPLAKLPALAGALAWFYFKVGITLLSLFWLFRMIEGRCGTVSRPCHGRETVAQQVAQQDDRPFPAWAKALTVLLGLR